MARLIPLMALLLVACSPAASPPVGHTLAGTFNLYGDSRTNDCVGINGYDDIKPGAQVTVKNEAGVIVGSGSLGSPTSPADTRYPCVYPFTVGNVAAAKFYSVEVSKRGALTYPAADLDKAGWKVGLSLGK